MVLFQVYADKKEEHDETEGGKIGVKIKKTEIRDEFLTMNLIEDSALATTIEQKFRKKGLSEFMSTLTPGAQNAIYSASFVWGYENAMKYLQNAMKVEEVKNASNEIERSKAVIESIKQQAEADQKITQKETFAWSYYNEDMKQAQAETAKTETVVERKKEKQEQKRQEYAMPLDAKEAVSRSISTESIAPQILYCAEVVEMAQGIEKNREEKIRENLLKLENANEADLKAKIKPVSYEQMVAELKKRQAEIIEEHKKTEEQIKTVLKVLDSFKHDSEENVKKIEAMLPSELRRELFLRRREYAKKIALKKRLERWLAFSKEAREKILGIPIGRLIKLASLSLLFK